MLEQTFDCATCLHRSTPASRQPLPLYICLVHARCERCCLQARALRVNAFTADSLAYARLMRWQVLSGSLDWSPLHTSPQFWKDNVSSLEDKDCQILKVLLKLLEASREVHVPNHSGQSVQCPLSISSALCLIDALLRASATGHGLPYLVSKPTCTLGISICLGPCR